MREIKFRCFYDGKMYDVKELSFSDGFVNVIIEMELDGLGKRMVSCDSERVKAIQQYTGLKDKNGKEIYEGDIVIASFKAYYEVIWEGACWKIRACKGNQKPATLRGKKIRVIGNIYENENLLSDGR